MGSELLGTKRKRMDPDSFSDLNPVTSTSDSENIGNILLFTISDIKYPITVDILHKITSSYGNVLRIVIFRENGIQAMVEFDSSTSAMHAKQQLNGACIYRECCVLDISYAKPKKLNVSVNNSDTWDYTIPDVMVSAASELFSKVTLLDATPENGTSECRPIAVNNNHNPTPPNPFAIRPKKIGSSVINVNDLDFKNITSDQLFNIFCLYGNVLGISIFSEAKIPYALIQMQNSSSAETAINHLTNLTFFNSRLTLSRSKHNHIVDKTRNYKDYSTHGGNRYLYSSTYSFIFPPSSVLFFHNCPPGFTREEMGNFLAQKKLSKPIEFTFSKSCGPKVSKGYLQFATVKKACEVLVTCNNERIKHSSRESHYRIFLSFSKFKFVHD